MTGRLVRARAENMEHEGFDHYRNFLRRIPEMVEMARMVAEDKSETHSYRDFKVGSALYALEPVEGEFAILASGNLKRERKTKFCAEMRVTKKALKAELTHAIGYVIVGTTDSDLIEGVSGYPTATLPTCNDCVVYIDGSHLDVPDYTPMVSTGLNLDRLQAFTLGSIRAMHWSQLRQGEEPPHHPVAFGFDNWDRRLAVYDSLVANENVLSEEIRSQFVRLALLGSAAFKAS